MKLSGCTNIPAWMLKSLPSNNRGHGNADKRIQLKKETLNNMDVGINKFYSADSEKVSKNAVINDSKNTSNKIINCT